MRQDHILQLVLVGLFSQSENPRNPREKEEKAKGEEAEILERALESCHQGGRSPEH